jgi:predicted RNase H-like HicB family nuclease
MARQIQLNISLEPVVEHDVNTDMYVIWYKEFPEAFAEGKTIDEAENNLIPTLELMWKEHPGELNKKLLENFINDSHRKGPQVVFPRK